MRLLTQWEIWKLRREARKLNKESGQVWAEAQEKKNNKYEMWCADHAWRFASIDAQIKENVSNGLIWQAERLLLPTPSLSDKDKWIPYEDLPPGYTWTVLTLKAMAELNLAIREEKKARLEIWESRAKIVGVIVTGLTGIIGTIIGLVAILKK